MDSDALNSDADSPSELVNILLVEDNPGDIRLTTEALRQNKLANRLYIVKDGVEALEFLFRRGQYTEAPIPDIILLDLNLPKKSGKQVLAEIKQDPELRMVPVVILTTSDSDRDILESYQLQVNCYITKPLNFAKFTEVVRAVEQFWFRIVKLPKPTGSRRLS